MNKTDIILKYFQKSDQLTVDNRRYQQTISSLFRWLTENDRVNNDITSKLFPNTPCTAKIMAKEEGITAGIEEVKFLLKTFTSLSFKSLINDGSKFKDNDIIAEIKGKSHDILAFERTILNILQRLSGIASKTNRLIHLINPQPTTHNPPPYLAATRKTPWMSLDKKAVAVGGGLTHRLNLSDGILIKDNHLVNIPVAQVLRAILNRVKGELIEIEVTNEEQAFQAINTFQSSGSTNHLAILLDNFSPSLTKSLLSRLNDAYDLSGIIFEASGGITEKNIKYWAKTGVDIISLGSLTHSVRAANLSLEMINHT